MRAVALLDIVDYLKRFAQMRDLEPRKVKLSRAISSSRLFVGFSDLSESFARYGQVT